jgi:hypothetical protein
MFIVLLPAVLVPAEGLFYTESDWIAGYMVPISTDVGKKRAKQLDFVSTGRILCVAL